jgi:hypothetical protein
MLPPQASIVGWRYELFDISGNKLFPQGAQSGRFLFPGGYTASPNLPQDALSFSGAWLTGPNTNKFTARCVPDTVIVAGEYQPTAAFKTAVANYIQTLIGGAWGFVGRDRSLPTARVLSISAGGIVQLSQNIGGVADSSFLRLLHVTDNNGNPIKGTFSISNINGVNYTLRGLTQLLSVPNGTARVDVVSYNRYGTINVGRAVVRKIGRPFEGYRGRASKRRAA